MSMKRGGRRMALEVMAGVAAWPQVASALFDDKIGWGDSDKVGVQWDGGFANPLASQPDEFSTEVVNGKGNPVVISFTKPKKWKLSTNAGITVQDYITAESAFVLVAPAQGHSVSDLPPEYVLDKVLTQGKASNAEKDLPPIMEAGPQDDGSSDPFTKKEMEKKETLQKQKNREKRNHEEIHGKTHLQLSENPSKQEQKLQTKAQLKLAQKSTGSLGKFDKKLKGELKSAPNRKFDPETLQNEKKRNLELLSKIVSVEGATLDHEKAKAGSQKKDKGKKPKRNAKAKR
ncbi:hypothetical protein GUITHDRAFT_110364 [Guillardia theta CCMP2712]|uniref:Uncharacterized protein n=1 Tax=Guillardia theta (strain CCMP2712) TaxID=905079 RepID=L1J4U8_GUITC|nr:hypothetical protein GUITHDRAFT_110364 [Guillardia theta CCMP2712]EKX43558.1 hypothetical protein GUITHDRAFT_110364 [Guillardia theta CCMP2712]|eukprot:XP_005830538.1 hypothetical protein GUITHDRAFT_110364 [Guillardia theta CCMP2712]